MTIFIRTHIYIGGLGLGFEYKFLCVIWSMWGFVIKNGAKMVNLQRIQHLAINPDLKTLNPDIIIVANSKLNSNN
jgi:hypothetical protein